MELPRHKTYICTIGISPPFVVDADFHDAGKVAHNTISLFFQERLKENKPIFPVIVNSAEQYYMYIHNGRVCKEPVIIITGEIFPDETTPSDKEIINTISQMCEKISKALGNTISKLSFTGIDGDKL